MSKAKNMAGDKRVKSSYKSFKDDQLFSTPDNIEDWTFNEPDNSEDIANELEHDSTKPSNEEAEAIAYWTFSDDEYKDDSGYEDETESKKHKHYFQNKTEKVNSYFRIILLLQYLSFILSKTP